MSAISNVRSWRAPRLVRAASLALCFGFCLFICCLFICCPSLRANALEPSEPDDFIAGSSTCPAPEAVRAEVFRLTSPESRGEHLSDARVRIVDAGASYEIEITRGSETFGKTYTDPSRECAKRVRFSAVYVVMSLMPPELGEPEPSEPAPEPLPPGPSQPGERSDVQAPAAVEKPPEPARPVAAAITPKSARRDEPASDSELGRWFEFELGAVPGYAVSNSRVPRITTLGGEAALAIAPGALALRVAIGAAPRTNFDIGEVPATMSEVTAGSGIRLRWNAAQVALAVDLEGLVARRNLEGDAALGNEAGSSWEVGARLAVSASYAGWSTLSPLAGLRTSYFPTPTELSVAPRGSIATLPNWWFGAFVGVRFAP